MSATSARLHEGSGAGASVGVIVDNHSLVISVFDRSERGVDAAIALTELVLEQA